MKLSFDPASVRDDPFEALRDGTYKCSVAESDYKSFGDGPPSLLIRFKVVDGPQKGHPFSIFLNVNDEVEKRRDWANLRLKRLLLACGHPGKVEDAQRAIAGKTVVVEVTTWTDKQGRPKNDAKNFTSVSETQRSAETAETSDIPF